MVTLTQPVKRVKLLGLLENAYCAKCEPPPRVQTSELLHFWLLLFSMKKLLICSFSDTLLKLIF